MLSQGRLRKLQDLASALTDTFAAMVRSFYGVDRIV